MGVFVAYRMFQSSTTEGPVLVVAGLEGACTVSFPPALPLRIVVERYLENGADDGIDSDEIVERDWDGNPENFLDLPGMQQFSADDQAEIRRAVGLLN